MLRRVAVAIREERASLRARRARIRDSGDRQGYYCYLANHSENEGEIPGQLSMRLVLVSWT